MCSSALYWIGNISDPLSNVWALFSEFESTWSESTDGTTVFLKDTGWVPMMSA